MRSRLLSSAAAFALVASVAPAYAQAPRPPQTLTTGGAQSPAAAAPAADDGALDPSRPRRPARDVQAQPPASTPAAPRPVAPTPAAEPSPARVQPAPRTTQTREDPSQAAAPRDVVERPLRDPLPRPTAGDEAPRARSGEARPEATARPSRDAEGEDGRRVGKAEAKPASKADAKTTRKADAKTTRDDRDGVAPQRERRYGRTDGPARDGDGRPARRVGRTGTDEPGRDGATSREGGPFLRDGRVNGPFVDGLADGRDQGDGDFDGRGRGEGGFDGRGGVPSGADAGSAYRTGRPDDGAFREGARGPDDLDRGEPRDPGDARGVRRPRALGRLARGPRSEFEFPARAGFLLPPVVEFAPLPNGFATSFPEFDGYGYVLDGGLVVIVDPGSHRIVAVLPLGERPRGDLRPSNSGDVEGSYAPPTEGAPGAVVQGHPYVARGERAFMVDPWTHEMSEVEGRR